MINRTITMAGAALLLALLWSCKPAEVKFPPYDNTAEVQAFYDADPERFVFATPEDLPKDLKWENGMDLPDIGSPQAVKGGTLHSGLTDFPRTLRHIGPDAAHEMRNYLLDEVAVNYAYRHPNAEGWYPGVAKEWAIDMETGTVYMRIDPEARWSDGERVTTEDALFSFYLRTSDHSQAPFGKHYFETKYKRITIYDEYTFAITVTELRPDLATTVFEGPPDPRHFYIEHGPDFVERYQWRFVPSTGPYVVKPEDVKKGRSVALTRLKNWWAADRKYYRNRFNPDRIELTVVRIPDKMFEGFKKGDFDVARLNLSKYWYEKLPDDDPLVKNGFIHKVTFYNDVPRSNMGLWMNTSKPHLGDIDVRRGIQHASNWELVVDKFFRNDWPRLHTSSDGYGEVSRRDIVPLPYSPEKAAAEFAKAGFTTRGPDGILMNDKGERLSFTVTTGYKTLEDALTILKQEAQKAGLEFNLEILESTAAWKKVQEKKHEITLTGTASSTSEFYPRYWDYWHSANAFKEDGKTLKPNTNNFTVTAVPELDVMIESYDRMATHEEKRDMAHKIEDVLFDHAAWVPGVDIVFYRTGFWRWVRWPEDFNVKRSELERAWHLYWIDEEMRRETMKALKAGKTFPPVIKVYDQYKAE